MKFVIFICVLFVSSLALAVPPTALSSDLLDAICEVESGCNADAVGDNGQALGAYQIHRAYWKDAVAFDKTLGGSYSDCADPEYARRVVIAYMTRYAPKAATAEQLSRLHNGGCRILKRQGTQAWNNTTAYWNKVKAALND